MIYFWLYFVYSVIGFIFLRDYTKKCYLVNTLPFNGSVLKFLIVSILCGGISTAILMISFFWALAECFFKKD